MRRLVYSMMVSLDGFIETPKREIDWVVIDEEIHTFANDQARQVGTFLYGRRLYAVMSGYWPTADANPSVSDAELEFARIWKDIPKVVFSRTLEQVEWNSRLVRDNAAEEIARLKSEPGKQLAIGGPTLASSVAELVDEYRPFVNPVVLGAGTPFFPASVKRTDLRLVETHTFRSGVVYLRYERADQ